MYVTHLIWDSIWVSHKFSIIRWNSFWCRIPIFIHLIFNKSLLNFMQCFYKPNKVNAQNMFEICSWYTIWEWVCWLLTKNKIPCSLLSFLFKLAGKKIRIRLQETFHSILLFVVYLIRDPACKDGKFFH